MKKVALVLVFLFATLALVQTSVADDPRMIRLEGVITDVHRDGITLLTRRGEVDIRVTDRTIIYRNGEPATLHDLQPRDHAAVVARFMRHRHHRLLVALRVRAVGR